MDDDFHRRVQRYGWDHAAGHYEDVWERPLKPAQDRVLERAALSTGDSVLDVACGTGLVSFRVATTVAPEGDVVGTDLSADMIEICRTRAQDSDIGNVTFKRMGAEVLDLPDDVFDVALCAFGLMYVPDPDQAVQELSRVLAPGGRAIAAVWGARKNCGWAEVFPIIDRRVESEVCPLFFQLGTGSALEVAFRDAGFTSICTDRIQVDLRFDSATDACAAVFEGGPVALAWQNFERSNREGGRQEYLASIAPYRKGDAYAIPGEFVITRGVTPEA